MLRAGIFGCIALTSKLASRLKALLGFSVISHRVTVVFPSRVAAKSNYRQKIVISENLMEESSDAYQVVQSDEGQD